MTWLLFRSCVGMLTDRLPPIEHPPTPAKGSNRCPKKQKEVDDFLLDIYIKAAQMLPSKFLAL